MARGCILAFGDHALNAVDRKCISSTRFNRPTLISTYRNGCVNSAVSSDASEVADPVVPEASAQVPLPPPPQLYNKAPRKYWNAIALAFLGDGVWEMYVRRKFFYPPSKMSQYYASVIENVRAEKQEEAYDALIQGTLLNDDERSVLKWGLNATGTLPKRFNQAPLKRQTYRAATALECLIGYLYTTDTDRLHEILTFLDLKPTQ